MAWTLRDVLRKKYRWRVCDKCGERWKYEHRCPAYEQATAAPGEKRNLG